MLKFSVQIKVRLSNFRLSPIPLHIEIKHTGKSFSLKMATGFLARLYGFLSRSRDEKE